VSWVAYVDESMRQRVDGSGLYVLAAAVFDPAEADGLRVAMTELSGRDRRFHWRDVQPAERGKAVTVVASLDALHLVVVGVGLDNPRQERGRRQCMTQLLWKLDQTGVTHVWLDARRPNQNARDQALVAALRARRLLGPNLLMDFAHAAEEPLTWLPDIVAGAVSAAYGDNEVQYLAPLETVLIDTIMIDLD
jgi:hypothetical protein